MLQAYSSNLSIVENQAFPFNNVVVDKGCAETLSAPASIQLNAKGIYLVEFDGFGTGAEAATGTVQLYVNGVPLAQAQSQFTTAAGDVVTFGFKTLVQVSENNCNCCVYSSPTTLQVIMLTTGLTEAHDNIVVTKIR